jgi:hypothetical protein
VLPSARLFGGPDRLPRIAHLLGRRAGATCGEQAAKQRDDK